MANYVRCVGKLRLYKLHVRHTLISYPPSYRQVNVAQTISLDGLLEA